MANGLTNEQMVERMYTEMVGIDGQSGLKGDVLDLKQQAKDDADDAKVSRKNIHLKIEGVESKMVTKAECQQVRKQKEKAEAQAEGREQWTWQKKAIVMTIRYGAIGAVIAIASFIIQYFKG